MSSLMRASCSGVKGAACRDGAVSMPAERAVNRARALRVGFMGFSLESGYAGADEARLAQQGKQVVLVEQG